MTLTQRLIHEYVKPHGFKLVLAVGAMVIVAATTAANAYLLQPALDEIFVGKDRTMLFLIPMAVLGIAIVKGIASYGQIVWMRDVGIRIIAQMQKDLFSHLMRADLATFHDQSSGHLISRFTNDIQMMRNAVSNVLTGIVKEFLTLIFLLGVMLYQSWELSLIALVVFPIAIWPVIRLGKRMRKLSHQTQEELGALTSQLDETFSGVRMVKSYGQEGREIGRATALIDTLYGLYYKAARVQAAASPLMETLAGVAVAGVIWYGGMQVLEGTTTPGSFFSFIAALIMAYKPMKSLSGLNTNLQEGLAAAARFFFMLDTPATIVDRDDAKPLSVTQGAIRFEDVHFSYPGGAGVEAIDLDIPAGKTVALVGPSGGGKSTLMNIVLRFYDPKSGQVVIDGQDIREVTMHSLRTSMALVSQEVVLFDDTVARNIAYGKPEATQAEIIQAAKHAAADAFIAELPEGYDTLIGPHGVKLSGGQRQRLAIARAMLKDAPILLLDEATSALDTTSERLVQKALARLSHNRTTLVIAHRLSTVRDADLIYVLDRGRIVESGSHDVLVSKGGVYHSLYAHQEAA